MLGSSMLEVAIGISFVYLFLSLICTAVNEMISSLMGLRAANLEVAINRIVASEELARKIYGHPLVAALHPPSLEGPKFPLTEDAPQKDLLDRIDEWLMPVKKLVSEWFRGRSLPSYIPAEVFSSVLLDIL